MRALVTILTGCCPVALELGALAGWLDAVEHRDELAHVLADLPNPGQPLTIPAQIRERVSGADPETIRTGLRRACNALAAPVATQLLTIAAAHSYRRGNGMIARIQAEAAVVCGGNTRLARLLLFTVNAGIPHPALKTN